MDTNIKTKSNEMSEMLKANMELVFNDVEVPDYVLRAFLKVRDTNRMNMWDAYGVADIMQEQGDVEAVIWLADLSNCTDSRIKIDCEKYMLLIKRIDHVLKYDCPIVREVYSIKKDDTLKEDMIYVIDGSNEVISIKCPEPVEAIIKFLTDKSFKISSRDIIQLSEKIISADYSGRPFVKQSLRINPMGIDVNTMGVYDNNKWDFKFNLKNRNQGE